MAIKQDRYPAAFPPSNSLTNSSTPLTVPLFRIAEYLRYIHNRLTNIDNTDVEAEGLAREISDVAHIVAYVENGDKPVEDRSPNSSPSHELRVDRAVV